MEHNQIREISASALYEAANAENITQNPTELTYNQPHIIKTPKPIDAATIALSDVRRIGDICEKMKKVKFPYGELLLGGASLFIGATLGALAGGIPYTLVWKSVLFYTVFPVLGIGCLLGYFFYKSKGVDDIHQYGERISEIMAKTDEGEDK